MISDAFAGLKDIDDIAPLGASDAACLENVRAVLARHGMLDRFGVTLLHAHFPVGADEVMLETCDPEARTLDMRPVAATSEKVGRAVGTSWRLSPDGEILAAAKCTSACVRDTKANRHGKKHVKAAGPG